MYCTSYFAMSFVFSTNGCTLRKSCSSCGVSRMLRKLTTGAYTTFSVRFPSGPNTMSDTISHLPSGFPLGSISVILTDCRYV